MPTQDNNEAASAPFGAYDPSQNDAILANQVAGWIKDRDRLQELIDTASASQSSTAGPAKGGNTQPLGTTTCHACEGRGVIYRCVVCCADEPRTGSCSGPHDPRSLCSFAAGSAHIAPQAAADTGAVALTDEQIDTAWVKVNNGWGIVGPELIRKFARALAAVPPAKAEGLNDEQRDAERYRWIRRADYAKLDAIKDKRWKGLDEAVDAAILDQQAKGEKA